MRLYTFTHFMLSSIQQGIQAAHAQSNLFLKYQKSNTKEFKALMEWAKAPTMVCLNGGNSAGLVEVYKSVEDWATFLRLPFDKFHEDTESLAGICTAVAVVVPPRIYNAITVMRGGNLADLPPDLSQNELDFAEFLNKFGLAR